MKSERTVCDSNLVELLFSARDECKSKSSCYLLGGPNKSNLNLSIAFL